MLSDQTENRKSNHQVAVLGLVLQYRPTVLVLGHDLRLSVLGLDSYMVLVPVPSLLSSCISVFFVDDDEDENFRQRNVLNFR